jgi:aminoglycoside phosphotransferase (APT) family kinase protein
LKKKLAGIIPIDDSIIHGDLYGDNILISDSGEISAILDFGFLSTVGDPRFDAGICASIINMYGDYASEVRFQLTRYFSDALGYKEEDLIIYRAAYTLLTATAYDNGGQDGHFTWCTTQWKMSDIKNLLSYEK